MAVTITNRTYNYNDNWPITSSLKLTANGPGGLKHPFDYPVGNDYPVFYGDKYSGIPRPLMAVQALAMGYETRGFRLLCGHTIRTAIF